MIRRGERRDIRAMGGGAPNAARLDLSSGGTFARASEASYYTQAPTDGSSAFLAWATSNTRRSADTRGDGIGASLLMECGRTNALVNSESFSGTGWTLVGSTTSTSGNADPDGGTQACRIQTASGNHQLGESALVTNASASIACTMWARANSGTDTPNLNFYRSADGRLALATSLGTTFVRLEKTATQSVSQDHALVPVDGRDWSAFGGVVAGARDTSIWGVQREEGAFYPSSYMRTSGSTVTRAADTLSYASGAYPVGFLTSGVVIPFAADASSSEIVSASEDWRLAQVGANDYVRIRATAGVCKAELVCGGSVVAAQTITFSRAQALTITAKPSAGSLTVAGATTGNGTNTGSGAAWASSATLYVGGDNSGANNVTGRFVGASIVQAA